LFNVTLTLLQKYGDKDNTILYGLYAVVVHQGNSLHCGHYIAYVRKQSTEKTNPHYQQHKEDWKEYKKEYGQNRQWYYTSDTDIRECQFEEVKNCKAYMLFYELLPFDYGTTI